jgi:hypothetical protein
MLVKDFLNATTGMADERLIRGVIGDQVTNLSLGSVTNRVELQPSVTDLVTLGDIRRLDELDDRQIVIVEKQRVQSFFGYRVVDDVLVLG